MIDQLQILPVDVAHAQLLSDLAKKIYIPHYPYLWNEGGVEWYIHEYAYPVEKISNELSDPNNLHFITYLNNELVGYLKLNKNANFEGFDSNTTLEIERIYIFDTHIKKGLGTQMVNFVKGLAVSLNKKNIILKAMDSADSALHFYKKNGFEIVGNFELSASIFTLMKPEYRGMFVLKHSLI